ncbi:MAG: cysteine desulfurase-like protein [Desulfitobacteriaceae bacterium]
MSYKMFPISEVREQFPALRRMYNDRPAIYFDGPGGAQVVRSSIEAITRYMENGGANLHGQFPTSHETEEIIMRAKQAAADLLGVKWHEIVFGSNMTTLTFSISRALARDWQEGDEIVVTEMDHRANVDPWLRVAKDKGMAVRWLKVDPETLTLDLSNLETVITEKTKLVAVSLASNAVGTMNDVAKIAQAAKAKGALVAGDAVHAVPHFMVDRDALGIDILLCSVYKFFGPHIGIAAIRSDLFARLKPYKLDPAPGYIPDKLETGTQNHEGIAGIEPAIEFIAGLGTGTSRRARIISGYAAIEEYENQLANSIRAALAQLPRIKLHQAAANVPKTPTIAFVVEGMSPLQVCQWTVEEYSIFVADGHFYASTLGDIMGVNATGGWVRAGLAPYNSEEEAGKFIQAMTELVKR